MRIGIDARLVLYQRGIGTFIVNLLDSLANLPGNHEIVAYVDDASASRNIPRDKRFTTKVIRPSLYPVWEQVALPVQAKLDGLDILHCPANTAPILMPHQTRLVMTVHDVIYLLPTSMVPNSPSPYQRMGRLYRQWVVPRAARHAHKIVTDSAHSRMDILHQLGLSPTRVVIIHAAPDSRFRPNTSMESKLSVNAQFETYNRILFTLGATDPRKNSARIIEAFARFVNQTNGEHQLVMAGLDRAAIIRFSAQVDHLGIANRVTLRGFITEDELVYLYHSAEMFLYPSLYEGFGLPVLEAMACGTPVIASTAGSIPEIAGDAAMLVDPTSTETIAQAMSRLTLDKDLRQKLIARGHIQAAKFSWDRAAQEMLEVYKSVME